MAEKNLNTLLSNIAPHLRSGNFVFCSISKDQLKSLTVIPLCLFHEEEGVSLIVEKSAADRECLQYIGCWSLITCEVKSDLNAAGFLATISKVLAEADIPLNAVSAYFHDHLFVPTEKAEQAVDLLIQLSASSRHRS